MRLVMTLLVRDEADIVADTIDYHLARGIDHVVATDNGSVDGTVEILEGYRERGVLTLLHEPGRDYRQPEWVTRMARLAATEHGADWVLHADADEFFWPEEGADLRALLEAVPEPRGALVAPVLHFRPHAREEGSWHQRLTIRESVSVKPGGGPVFHVIHRAHPAAVVGPANKVVEGLGLGVVAGWRPVSCLHFPMRSWAQYERKVRRGGRAFKPWSYEAHVEQDGLAGFYRSHVVDDASARAGLAEGRLVYDDRVGRHLAALRRGETPVAAAGPPRGSGARAWPHLPEDVAELRARAAQAAWVHAHDPERDPVRLMQEGARGLPALARARLRARLAR